MATTIDFKTVAQEIGAKDDKVAKARWVALGYITECSRCGGRGKFSYNQRDGDVCYGCNGSGKAVVKPTAKLVQEAKTRIAAGALDAYFERNRRINAARKVLPSLVAEAETVYRVIGNAYDKAYRAKWVERRDDVAANMEIIKPFQDEANEIFWRKVKEIQRMTTEVFRGEQLVDAEVASGFIQSGIEALKDVVARYQAAVLA
jgi:excinuclease UvrABC ATPase subunit